MRYLAGATLSPDAFAAIQRLCSKNDTSFPPSYAAWLELLERADAMGREQGLPTDPVVIDVHDFSVWCLKASIQPSLDALRAYMIVQRRMHLRPLGDESAGRT